MVPSQPKSAEIVIVYDGECVFCSNYVRFSRLREANKNVVLIDARANHHIMNEINARGFDLDEGMVLIRGDQFYYGPDVMNQIALMTTGSTTFNKICSLIFRSQRRSTILYPILRGMRNFWLTLAGKPKIENLIQPDL